MRKFSQKTDRIGKQHPLLVRQNKATRGGIKCRKKFVLGRDICASEQIQERRFACVRVAYDCGHWPLMAFTPLPLHRSSFANGLQFALESRDSFLDAATINFQLCFTRAARANTASLP